MRSQTGNYHISFDHHPGIPHIEYPAGAYQRSQRKSIDAGSALEKMGGCIDMRSVVAADVEIGGDVSPMIAGDNHRGSIAGIEWDRF